MSDSDWAIPTGILDGMKEDEQYKNRKMLSILLSCPYMKLLWDMSIVDLEKERLKRKVK